MSTPVTSKANSSPRSTGATARKPESVKTSPKPVPRPSSDGVSLSGEARNAEEPNRAKELIGGLDRAFTSLPSRAMDEITTQDHRDWGGQITDQQGNVLQPGHKEFEDSHYETVGEYWDTTEFDHLDGRDTDQAWSAAYVSSVHQRAGISNFEPSIRHSTYINDAIEARNQQDASAPYWGFRPEERAPQPGDLLCWNRAGASASFDKQQGGSYESHCDFVKSVNDGTITTLGGNVADSVSTREFSIDENGLLNDPGQDWLAVLAPKNLRWDLPQL